LSTEEDKKLNKRSKKIKSLSISLNDKLKKIYLQAITSNSYPRFDDFISGMY
jgi:hypothetical protein